MVRDLPVTRQDVKLAKETYGQYIYALQQKTVNKNVDHVVVVITNIPKQILKEYKRIILYIDVMFINGIKFLLTVSRHLNSITSQYILSKKNSGYVAPIKLVYNMYAKRVFLVTTILTDP